MSLRCDALMLAALVAACNQPTRAPSSTASPAPSDVRSTDLDLANAIVQANAEQGAAPNKAPIDANAGGGDYYGQPLGERAAQQNLPQSQDALWRTLTTTHIREDVEHGTYTAAHSNAVRALVGGRVTISGFIMPLEAAPRFRHFILSRYTPVCDFCPPGAPNEVIEVWSDAPISPSYELMRATGRFSLTNDAEMGLFFRLDGATIEPAASGSR